MNIERLSTGIIFFGSLAILFWIMPQQVETVDYGRVLPSTVPTIALSIIILCSGIQAFASTSDKNVDLYATLRTVLFIVLIVFAVHGMDAIGFEYCAPPLALFVMLLIGERRWHWLATGTLLIPIGVWFLVENILGRQLP